MKKLGVILDSSCGLSKREAEEKGFMFLPIVIDFDGKEYYTGVDIDNEFLYKNMSLDKDVKTAAIKMGHMEELFKKASKEYERVLFVSLSKHLSSINSTAKNLAKNISNNIYVYDSEFITPWILYLLPKLKKIIDEEKDIEDAIKLMDKLKGKMTGYVIPGTLDYLYKGGRITKAQYLAGNFLKIFPIVRVENGSLSQKDIIKARTVNKALEKMVEIVLKEKKEFEEKEGVDSFIRILDINSKEMYDSLILKLENKGIDISQIETVSLTSEIIAHIGPKALGLGFIMDLDKI